MIMCGFWIGYSGLRRIRTNTTNIRTMKRIKQRKPICIVLTPPTTVLDNNKRRLSEREIACKESGTKEIF